MNRRPDLDWLRVIAFGLLILYHSGMAWSGWEWHINSSESLPWLREAMRFTNRWRIPLIYMVSGGAIVLALGQRPPSAFALDRVRRLLLPLVFGILVIVPPQVYIERLYLGQFAGSFIDWLPQAYVGIYPAGNLSWNHLWFVGYVLILTFVLLPVFLWARTPHGLALQARLAALMSATGLHWLMTVPLAASILLLAPYSHNVNRFIGDWHGDVTAALLLLYGGFVFGTPQMLATLNRQRWFSFAVAVAVYVALDVLVFRAPPGSHVRVLGLPVFAPLSAINTVAWLFAFIGLANHHLTTRPRFLVRATELVYPFYMIHQTVTVITVYWLLKRGVPALPGYALTVLSTFGVTWLICAGAVRPWPWVRPLFGMKPSGPEPAALPASTTAL
jgi:glucans biosynthesis protein C